MGFKLINLIPLQELVDALYLLDRRFLPFGTRNLDVVKSRNVYCDERCDGTDKTHDCDTDSSHSQQDTAAHN